jgi:hypothetical protein
VVRCKLFTTQKASLNDGEAFFLPARLLASELSYRREPVESGRAKFNPALRAPEVSQRDHLSPKKSINLSNQK